VKIYLQALAILLLTRTIGLPQQPLTLGQAVEQAADKYPALRASVERVSAAGAGVDLARTVYLPRVDFLAQLNRATRNNVFGLVLPQSVLPSISGPVLGTNDLTSVWGSATGVLVSWEPFDFGLRREKIDAAQSGARRAQVDVDLTRLQVQTAAADAFLTLLAAEQNVSAARAGVERAKVFAQVVGSLASSGLRPGAEASRARAESALAQTQLSQSQQAAEVARASLSQFLGVEAAQITVQSGPMLALPPETAPPAGSLSDHPLAREQQAAVEEVKASERVLARSYFPRFTLQGALYARGTGARTDGATGGAFSGVGPNIQNWAVGMTVQFPLMDLPSLRARREAELHHELAETAQYNRVVQDLDGQLARASAQLEGARRVALDTPAELEAARAAHEQAAARYRTGLGSVVEVADAQRLLIQAETDDALAKLGVWRGLLAVAAARGDLQPFLQLAGK
jgi:outer membrane protein